MLFIMLEACNLFCCLTIKDGTMSIIVLHQPVLSQLCVENISEDVKLFYEALRLSAFSLRNTHTHTHIQRIIKKHV